MLDRRNTKERILHQSILLFGAFGYDRVSVRQLAASVGIKESSIYNHYSGKDEILDTIIERFVQRHAAQRVSLEQFRVLVERIPLEEALDRLVVRYRDDRQTMLYMLRILLMEQYRSEKYWTLAEQLLNGETDHLDSLFRFLVDSGRLRPFPCRETARLWTNNTLAYAIEVAHRVDAPYQPCETQRLCMELILRHRTDRVPLPL